MTKKLTNNLYVFCVCFQSAYLATTNSNTNVVRVAPRQKYQTTNNHHASSNTLVSSKSAGSTAPMTVAATPNTGSYHPNSAHQFPIQSFNYISYQSQLPGSISNSASYETQSTLAKTNPFLVKGGLSKCSDTHHRPLPPPGASDATGRFNSLKALGIKKSPQFYSMRRCKRHHSYTGPNLVSVTAAGLSASQNRISSLMDYDQHPLYENLTDSIQIHETSLPLDSDTNSSGNNGTSGASSTGGAGYMYSTKSHKDRLSIHRSDSGISNSSYEYLPQPAPRIGGSSRSKVKAMGNQSAPMYMNLPYVAFTANSLHEASEVSTNPTKCFTDWSNFGCKTASLGRSRYFVGDKKRVFRSVTEI